jgi:hypothetical protein
MMRNGNLRFAKNSIAIMFLINLSIFKRNNLQIFKTVKDF